MKFVKTSENKRINSGLPHLYLGQRVINFPLYKVWNGMRQRCYNPNVKGYHNYGGRGIKVCKKWRESFICFYEWAINNGYEKGKSIDRINNNGNYCPSNCRLATPEQQARNRRSSKCVIWDGKEINLATLCDKFKIEYWLVNSRISKGWDIKKALTTSNLAGKKHLYKKRPLLDMCDYASPTDKIYIDRNNIKHIIYKGRTGRLFIKKVSCKGLVYKYFLDDNGNPYNKYIRKTKYNNYN